MNKRLLIFLLALLVCTNISAQNSRSPIVFDALNCDFGDVGQDASPVVKAFTFRNRSSKTVELDSVVPSCSCVKVDVSAWTLKPGEGGIITASFDPAGMDGEVLKHVTVYVGSEAITLELKANVVLSAEDIAKRYPLSIVSGLKASATEFSFGNVSPGAKYLRTISLLNASDKEVKLSAVLSKPSSRFQLFCPESLGAGERADIQLLLAIPEESKEYGTVRNSIVLKVDGRTCSPDFAVEAHCVERGSRTAQKKPRISVPDYVSLRKHLFGDALSGTLRIENAGNADLVFRKVELEGPVSCELKDGTILAAGETVKLPVTGSRTGAAIILYTNDPLKPYLRVEIQ